MTPSPGWDKARHADRRPFLAARAAIARAVREWFWAQGFTEAEPAMLAVSPGAETHIDAFEVGERYLHTSPEFAMKKLLAAGERKLFFLGKTWRRGETGPLHAPEFTMIEWYGVGSTWLEQLELTEDLVRTATHAATEISVRFQTSSSSFHWKDITNAHRGCWFCLHCKKKRKKDIVCVWNPLLLANI